jgi:hypothetical protein
MCQAVRKVSGTAEASSKPSPSRSGMMLTAGTLTISAQPPLRVSPMIP